MVSVLLASYNGEKYIREQLESILNQTFSDLSIVISDDLSTDGTPAIIREYEERYPGRVRSLRNSERSGSAQNNFFRLLKVVTDEYIMLCDQDDVWLPDKAEVTLREMKKLETEWGKAVPLLVHGDLSVTDKEGSILHESMAEYQKIAVHDNRFSHYLVENNITGNTVMINKAFLEFLTDVPRECVMHDWCWGFWQVVLEGYPTLTDPWSYTGSMEKIRWDPKAVRSSMRRGSGIRMRSGKITGKCLCRHRCF